jgi:hypothetical protein
MVQTRNPNAKWYNSTEWWKHRSLEWWKDRLEVVAIVFGVFYAIVTFLMWHDSHKNFALDQRAWLGIYNEKTQISQSKNNDLPGIKHISFWVRNSGRTPALNIDGFVIVTTAAYDQPVPNYETLMAAHGWTEKTQGITYHHPKPGEPYVLGQNIVIGDIVAPGSEGPFDIDFNAIKDNTLNREAPDGSTLWVYVLGAFTYDDIYKHDWTYESARHKTTFCLVNHMPYEGFASCPSGQTMN